MPISPVLAPGNGGVLVASPSPSLREQVVLNLHDRRWLVQEVSGGADALVKLESGNWQVLFLDRRLPDLDVEELMGTIKRRFPGIEVVVVDSDISPLPAAGGFRSLAQRWPRSLQPATSTEGISSAKREISNALAEQEKAALLSDLHCEAELLPGMIGRHAAMQRISRLVRLVAPRRTTALITGPTGTGKELVARAIHQLSPRAARPFVVVNCAAIPETLLESELFGYARGSFTGAVQAYSGRIYAAQGGTLFLDEIGELPLSVQAKLLRFLDQKEVQRLGSTDSLRVDVRVVAATNIDLARAVEERRFRGDLFYRLSAFPLELASLSERAEDILPLAEHFLRQMAAESRSAPLQLGPEAASLIQAYRWPGNVRELQLVMERAVILADESGTIGAQHLHFSCRAEP